MKLLLKSFEYINNYLIVISLKSKWLNNFVK